MIFNVLAVLTKIKADLHKIFEGYSLIPKFIFS